MVIMACEDETGGEGKVSDSMRHGMDASMRAVRMMVRVRVRLRV